MPTTQHPSIKLAIAIAAALVTLATACGSSAPTATPDTTRTTPSDDSTEIATEPHPSAVSDPTPEPTTAPTPEPTTAFEPTDDERYAAALTALETNGVDGLIAWDLIDHRITPDGLVRINICGWTGETVFDNVIETRWQTIINDDNTLTATSQGTNPTTGDCLNTQLIESALDHLRRYDEFYTAVIADPATFVDRSEEAARLLTEREFEVIETAFAKRAEDGTWAITPYAEPGYSAQNPAPLLQRRATTDAGLQVLEFVGCRDMRDDYGVYRGDVLISNSLDGEPTGTHVISHTQLTAFDGTWRLHVLEQGVWGDCYNTGDWRSAADTWKPGDAWIAVEW